MKQTLGDALTDMEIEIINQLFSAAQKSGRYTEAELKIIGKFCDDSVKDINKERECYVNAISK